MMLSMIGIYDGRIRFLEKFNRRYLSRLINAKSKIKRRS